KPLEIKKPADFGVDLAPRLKVVKTVEPPGRKAGVKVANAAELIAKLKGAGKVLLADAPQLGHALAEEMSALIVGMMGSYDAVLAPATASGKNFMPRVAALLDVMQISDIIKVV